jgi:hypothetical protein
VDSEAGHHAVVDDDRTIVPGRVRVEEAVQQLVAGTTIEPDSPGQVPFQRLPALEDDERAGVRGSEKVGEVIATHVIARPHVNLDLVLPLGRQDEARDALG